MKRSFDPRAVDHWPGKEELGFHFAQVLGFAQEGGAAVSECFLTASRIDLRDSDSWRREWKRTADLNLDRADRAAKEGHLITARSNYLRAVGCYLTALADVEPAGHREHGLLDLLRRGSRAWLDLLSPKGQVVTIPWTETFNLQGYFLPAADRGGRLPLVICIGEPDTHKEQYLFRTARFARERGMSLLAVDLLGSAGAGQIDAIVKSNMHIESSIGSILDYVEMRKDVDLSKIAILSDQAGSSFVARGLTYDRRVAAAVCDGGIWDALEQSFITRRMQGWSQEALQNRWLANAIQCPLLVTIGENGWLDADVTWKTVQQLRRDGTDITLKIFGHSETASYQGHADNPSLAQEFSLDWISDRFRKKDPGFKGPSLS